MILFSTVSLMKYSGFLSCKNSPKIWRIKYERDSIKCLREMQNFNARKTKVGAYQIY